ncbi:MAG: ATP-dependent protease [Dehalococcoidia bacterium]|nr:ATP-dependent protease [Dehalococcoidia bacterium]
MVKELSPDQLRRVCDPQSLELLPRQGFPYLQGIVGQQRAVEALEFGLGIGQKGFNVYVGGPAGTGKSTAVRTYLEEMAQGKETPPDLCLAHDFANPDRPVYLRFPPGKGRVFKEEMDALVQQARREIAQAFESDDYSARREAITQQVVHQREEIFGHLSQQAQAEGFILQPTQVGLFLAPAVNGQPLSDQQYLQLPEEIRHTIQERRQKLDQEGKVQMKEIRRLERQTQDRMGELDREVADYVVGGLIEDIQEKYQVLPKVVQYLQDVRGDMVSNVQQFFAAAQQPGPGPEHWAQETAFRKYQATLLVENGDGHGAPVVVEQNPTYPNLFGRIEKEAVYGALQTDFTLVKAGSLLRANGGYLVVNADELVRAPFAYEALKRALRNRETTIEELGEQTGFVTTRGLRPEPIPLDVKVVLLGSPSLYYQLHALDEGFREVFKVRADFGSDMERTPQGVLDYLNFMTALGHRENLMPLNTEAAARLIEEGSRLAEDQEKLSTRFGDLADIIREANYWATADAAPTVTKRHVEQAVEAKVYRSNLVEERLQEMTERGTLMVDTDGAVVGQINGLSVLSMGEYSFGRPVRITASVGLGQAGLLDIERESRLGGPLHTKGVLILSGYLSYAYAQDKPLTLSGRLVLEQSYDGVEGDSASSAELYALLSQLSGLPIKQGIAVTGSVNQRGQTQAIGGVNVKIEGFFDLCRIKGLTGRQGVMIPASNIPNLMLRDDVVEAVRQGKFHIYAVEHVKQGIEVLTGVPAGERGPDGAFPQGTVNDLVDQRLRQMAEALQHFGALDGAGPTRPAREEEEKP